ncbi:hypothetical protein R1flu_006440 [Riccia fluitans]|uniref:Uncharacterized protein n=1 Tax=Riccia fluitans TaxID=41844 RepID=A0ABD1YW10_9MARC
MSGGSHSPNLGLLDQEASMQNIDRLVEALEMEAIELRMSKRRKLFSDEPSSSALQVYQPLDREEPSSLAVQVYQLLEHSIVPSFPNFGITLEELIVPPSKVEAEFLKLLGRKYKKDAWQDIAPWFGFSLTHSQPRSEGWVLDDFKKFSLEGHPDGYALDKQDRLVINQVQRMIGKANRSFCSTTVVLLVVAHEDPRMVDYHLDWHMWISFEIQGHLGHDRNDKFSGSKFCEGWQAIMRIVCIDFLARQATARHEPLLLEAHNAFINTKVECSEKGELVCERETLKEELNKAKEMAVEAEQRTEVVRLEKETLQQ